MEIRCPLAYAAPRLLILNKVPIQLCFKKNLKGHSCEQFHTLHKSSPGFATDCTLTLIYVFAFGSLFPNVFAISTLYI